MSISTSRIFRCSCHHRPGSRARDGSQSVRVQREGCATAGTQSRHCRICCIQLTLALESFFAIRFQAQNCRHAHRQRPRQQQFRVEEGQSAMPNRTEVESGVEPNAGEGKFHLAAGGAGNDQKEGRNRKSRSNAQQAATAANLMGEQLSRTGNSSTCGARLNEITRAEDEPIGKGLPVMKNTGTNSNFICRPKRGSELIAAAPGPTQSTADNMFLPAAHANAPAFDRASGNNIVA